MHFFQSFLDNFSSEKSCRELIGHNNVITDLFDDEEDRWRDLKLEALCAQLEIISDPNERLTLAEEKFFTNPQFGPVHFGNIEKILPLLAGSDNLLDFICTKVFKSKGVLFSVVARYEIDLSFFFKLFSSEEDRVKFLQYCLQNWSLNDRREFYNTMLNDENNALLYISDLFLIDSPIILQDIKFKRLNLKRLIFTIAEIPGGNFFDRFNVLLRNKEIDIFCYYKKHTLNSLLEKSDLLEEEKNSRILLLTFLQAQHLRNARNNFMSSSMPEMFYGQTYDDVLSIDPEYSGKTALEITADITALIREDSPDDAIEFLRIREFELIEQNDDEIRELLKNIHAALKDYLDNTKKELREYKSLTADIDSLLGGLCPQGKKNILQNMALGLQSGIRAHISHVIQTRVSRAVKELFAVPDPMQVHIPIGMILSHLGIEARMDEDPSVIDGLTSHNAKIIAQDIINNVCRNDLITASLPDILFKDGEVLNLADQGVIPKIEEQMGILIRNGILAPDKLRTRLMFLCDLTVAQTAKVMSILAGDSDSSVSGNDEDAEPVAPIVKVRDNFSKLIFEFAENKLVGAGIIKSKTELDLIEDNIKKVLLSDNPQDLPEDLQQTWRDCLTKLDGIRVLSDVVNRLSMQEFKAINDKVLSWIPAGLSDNLLTVLFANPRLAACAMSSTYSNEITERYTDDGEFVHIDFTLGLIRRDSSISRFGHLVCGFILFNFDDWSKIIHENILVSSGSFYAWFCILGGGAVDLINPQIRSHPELLTVEDNIFRVLSHIKYLSGMVVFIDESIDNYIKDISEFCVKNGFWKCYFRLAEIRFDTKFLTDALSNTEDLKTQSSYISANFDDIAPYLIECSSCAGGYAAVFNFLQNIISACDAESEKPKILAGVRMYNPKMADKLANPALYLAESDARSRSSSSRFGLSIVPRPASPMRPWD